MEFTVVNEHTDCPSKYTEQTTTIVSVAEEYLFFLGCNSKTEYIQSISLYHNAYGWDTTIQSLRNQGSTVFFGHLVFRHSQRRATILFTADLAYTSTALISIHKIKDIRWEDETQFQHLLGELFFSVHFNTVQWRFVIRDEKPYLSFPASIFSFNAKMKQRLQKAKCLFSINVMYKTENGFQTHRSVLVPASLLNRKFSFPSSQLFGICESFGKDFFLNFLSVNLRQLLNVDDADPIEIQSRNRTVDDLIHCTQMEDTINLIINTKIIWCKVQWIRFKCTYAFIVCDILS